MNTFSQVVGSIIYKIKIISKTDKNNCQKQRKLYNDLLELSALSDDFKVYNSCANFVFVKHHLARLVELSQGQFIVIRFMGDYIRISVGTEEETKN